MSELIDRRELLKCFCITKDGKRIPEVDCDNHEITISIKDIKRIIREQPTVNARTPMANIVEKLEELKNGASGCNGVMCENCEYNDICFEGEQSFKVALDKAISIVKQEINNGLE